MLRLVDKVAPQKIDEIIGQDSLIKSPKYLFVLKGDFDILILSGPTGTGKSTFARLLGDELCLPFYRLHASSSGSQEIKKIVDTAKKTGKCSIIFIDEIHRFTKVQQDLLLDVVDEKYAKIIGASTENPYFSLTPALRSRSYFMKFKPLSHDALKTIAEKALAYIVKEKNSLEIINRDKLIEKGIKIANGDARKMLNFLEVATSGESKDGILDPILDAEDTIAGGIYTEDEHYDLLSALIKSVRGSDPDAALVWCFKLLKSGVDPSVIFRRLAISCSEDIGNAYPDASVFLKSVWELFERVGMPEGEILISHAVTFLASCPKSNRSYEAGKRVKDFLNKNEVYVPENIKHNPKGYKYPFEYGNFVKQRYFQEGLVFYNPSDFGFEKKIKDRLRELWGSMKDYER
ncbi:AAA family ATPase [Calditerrivibrio nitroreducens]|uniref:Replication-associated recombination protein A n=1 Tax=Calditerrivibrio nitroreducens (strain DSM 19672 / NBRC 101217 / Yu37-1) TaxID=768670 RepID=E4TJZ4_CALNY|nr:AAA family ATPase [Calditerrivibrio nitroreducens]ADR18245.1 AAA ATPase central domain protein [Calditerrivibrio nitroreducens DSM 19672]